MTSQLECPHNGTVENYNELCGLRVSRGRGTVRCGGSDELAWNDTSRSINMSGALKSRKDRNMNIKLEFKSTDWGCQFYPTGEYLRFVRVPENVPVGGEVLQVEVHPRRNLSLQPVDKADDAQYFSHQEINSEVVSVTLAKSLEDLVDSENPHNVLKFRLVCDYDDGEDTISSYLSVTVYVEDVNDHAPEFLGAPYHVTVDELTPTGLTIFRGIHAVDQDKPNTPNSDVQYSIVDGNDDGKFGLESSHRAALVVRRPLDFDAGDRQFELTIMASDRGSPPRNSTTTIEVTVLDNDDLSPKFTREIYKTQVTEFYPVTGERIHEELLFSPPIMAFDQDLAIDTPVRYDIIAGNDRRLFILDAQNGSLFLEKEIDLDRERNLPGNTFVLQIQASQIDNPLKTGVARVEVEVLDLNDNLPEFEVDLYNISIVENLPNGFSVLQVIATDRDQGDNGEFIYQLDDPSQAFIIDPRTGWLTVRDQGMLDREKQASLTMTVYAKEKVPSVVHTSINNSEAGLEASSVTVEVTLLDANDNNPTFIPSNVYEFTVESDAKIGDIVGQVTASDPDLGRNGMLLYDLQRTSNLSTGVSPLPFAVDPQTGQIVVIDSPLTEGRHALFIEASDQPANPSERRFSLAVVTVQVLRPGSGGHGHQEPDFIGAPYEFWVGANVGVGTSVGQIRVTDVVDKNHIIYDMLHSYHEGVPFAVEERSGTITVVEEVAKFERTLYDFEAVVTNGQELTLVTNITIHVVDFDDDKDSNMKGSPIEFRVHENLSGALVGHLLNQTNNTTDQNRWKSLHFIIANQQDVMDKFAVSQDGTIYTQRGLDREERDSYRITVIAENSRGVIRGNGLFQVNIVVEDVNDNPPVFEFSSYEGQVPENSSVGTEVTLSHLIQASDADIGENAEFNFTLDGEDSDMFGIDQKTGKVLVKNRLGHSLDREDKSVYALKIIAQDNGNLTSEANLTIHIEDINDNAPHFVQMVVLHDKDVEIAEPDQVSSMLHLRNVTESDVYNITTNLVDNNNKRQMPPIVMIPENTPVGTSVLMLIADDKDIGINSAINYALISEAYIPSAIKTPNSIAMHKHYFNIHPLTGEVSVARSLPPEVEFRLNITATDGGDLSDSIIIRIFVKDTNDHAPTFKKSWYNFDLSEGHYSSHALGKIEAIDEDYGDNGKVTYAIMQNGNDLTPLPFSVSEHDGLLTVSGEIDREKQDSYVFKVLAQDHGPINHRQKATVDVEIHILDVNDNAPMFYGHEEILQISQESHDSEMSNGAESSSIPVYHSIVVENSPVGTFVSKILANDSDFTGNGNGLLLFDIPRKLNPENADLFAIDSKEGIITTIGKLDFETKQSHNVTIVASDLGNPSLSSTAILTVDIVDIADETEVIARPMFAHRYYEVEVEENCIVPVALLALNVTEPYRGLNHNFSIVPSNDSSKFKIDSTNGTLYLVKSPDREKQARLEVKIQAETLKRGRGIPIMIYPVTPERLSDLASNEVKIIVRVKDVNDNPPKFTTNGRPIVAAIPTTANYGYQIVRLQAFDKDEGLNAEIRYQILGRVDDESHKFAIDPITGQVRSIVSFARDAGRVYGFDVKATDKRGADDGKSSIANVFVYVLDEDKQLVMVVGSKPTTIERNMRNITIALYNATGLDVRVRKLEPHIDRDLDDGAATDMYLYAVDPQMNAIIDTDTLQHVLSTKQSDIKQQLERYRVLEITSATSGLSKTRSQRHLLSSLEVGVVVLGCVVFIGALAAAICVGCVRRGKQRKQQKCKAFQSQVGFTITNPQTTLGMGSKTQLFPTTYLEGLGCGDTTDTYVDMHSDKSLNYNQHHVPRHNYHSRHQHDINCSRHHHNRRRSSSKLNLVRSPSNLMEASITSLHSSGKDSGIADGMRHVDTGRCICGHSTSHSSGESSK
ncbi:cadherin-89D [Anabrus simplex]|uniref:cadherin-89D n=1 Tax=Anabrus simplex TaxID=316456 RepID=UPI0035A3B0D9